MSSQLLYAWVAYRNRPGAKYSFYQKEIKKFLGQALGHMAIRPLGEEVLARDKRDGGVPGILDSPGGDGVCQKFSLTDEKTGFAAKPWATVSEQSRGARLLGTLALL